MIIKQLSLVTLFFMSSMALLSQSVEEYVVLSVYKRVLKKVDNGIPIPLKPTYTFKDHSQLIYMDEDAQVIYTAAISKGTFGMGRDGVKMPLNIDDGDRLETIDDLLKGDRKKLPRNFFKEEILNNLQEQEIQSTKGNN